MAIIGKIRKHSGLAVIVVGVAIAAFVIGDFSKKSNSGATDIGVINGENIPYFEFSEKVDKTIEAQKQSSGDDKITDQETYQIRQSTWQSLIKEYLLGEQYEELGLTVTSDELFDQIQGRQPHRYILQYFKDPATGQYDPAIVLQYLKNLDKMEPQAKEQWIQFEKAIKDDRQETKYNNLVMKGYYVPAAFLKKDFVNQSRGLKMLVVSPQPAAIADSMVKVTDADFEKFYEKNKIYFFQEEATRDLDYVVFEVKPSEIDRKRIEQDVMQLYTDFQNSSNILGFSFANSDTKIDTGYVKKGTYPAQIDTLIFSSKPGAVFPPFEFNNNWYMSKLLDIQERPDSISGSQILIAYEGTGNENIKRTKEEAKAKIDSLFNALKKNPARFAEVAKQISDYPSAKEDGGDLKWFPDNNPNYEPFFNAGLSLKPNEMKVVDTRIGYSLFMLTNKSQPVKKVKAAVLVRAIEPSNQTFQDIYMQASTFAGQNKTTEAFEKGAAAAGIQKRSAPGVRQMDSYVMGLPSAREMVRWAFAEKTKVSEVSPVFDVTGKYAVAILRAAYEKGQQPLEAVKQRIEPSVKNMKKIDMVAENITNMMKNTKDITALATRLNAKLDTSLVTFSGFNQSSIGRENEVVGQLFHKKKGELVGPLTGNFGAYVVYLEDVIEAPMKEDFSYEKMQQYQNFNQRVQGSLFPALEKSAKIVDNRLNFY
jgi:peptidyl-prolyl cis-trans isomerase D